MRFSQEIGESLMLKFGQLARDLTAEGKEIISMAVGEPNFKTPVYIEEAVIRALKDGYTHYSNSQGLVELRDYIAKDINEHYKTSFSRHDVIVTPGVKSSLHLALSSILEPGDEVIVFSPYYVTYLPLIKIAEPQTKIIDIPLTQTNNIDLETLEKAMSKNTKCIIVNSPSNPTGKIITKQEVESIIRLAKRYNTYILTDEIYDKLIYTGKEFSSFLGQGEDELVIYANGYSKSYCLIGYRIGYVIAPNMVLAKMLMLQQNINTNTNTYIQRGMLSIYQNRMTHLLDYLPLLEKRVKQFDEFIKTSKLFKGVAPMK